MADKPKKRRSGGPLSAPIGVGVIRDKDGKPAREYSERELYLSDLLRKAHKGTEEDMRRYLDALAEDRPNR